MVTRNKKEFYRAVFRKIMSYYDEIKSSHGTQSCEVIYQAIERGTTKIKYNPRVITTSPSDFICDVEITAEKTLTEKEFSFFRLLYINKNSDVNDLTKDKSPDNKVIKLKHTIQEKLGLAFKVRGLYPLAKYLKPKDLR